MDVKWMNLTIFIERAFFSMKSFQKNSFSILFKKFTKEKMEEDEEI